MAKHARSTVRAQRERRKAQVRRWYTRCWNTGTREAPETPPERLISMRADTRKVCNCGLCRYIAYSHRQPTVRDQRQDAALEQQVRCAFAGGGVVDIDEEG